MKFIFLSQAGVEQAKSEKCEFSPMGQTSALPSLAWQERLVRLSTNQRARVLVQVPVHKLDQCLRIRNYYFRIRILPGGSLWIRIRNTDLDRK